MQDFRIDGKLPRIGIGSLKASSYYTAMFAGYLAMVSLMLRQNRREKYGIRSRTAFLFATAELVVGVLGCKLLYILENLEAVRENGISLGGFSFYGSVLLIPLLMPLVGRLMGIPWKDSLDNAAVCILAMLATIRIGCFLEGCCGGWPIVLGDYSIYLPTQLMESICDFLILSYLLKCERENREKGFLYPIFLLSYGCVRFLIEFLRDTPKDWLWLSHAQWFSIAAILMALVYKVLVKKEPESAPAPGKTSHPERRRKKHRHKR